MSAERLYPQPSAPRTKSASFKYKYVLSEVMMRK